MPKQVDHDERRRGLGRTAAAIVAARGLDALTFRELAARAGVSVALVQHYFGTKAALLAHTLDQLSDRIGAAVAARLADLGSDAAPGTRVLSLAEAFLPTDEDSRDAMVVYLSFAAGALTDPSLGRGAAFTRGQELRAHLASELAAAANGDDRLAWDPADEASTIVALLLGLSLVALLPDGGEGDLLAPVRRHLSALGLQPD